MSQSWWIAECDCTLIPGVARTWRDAYEMGLGWEKNCGHRVRVYRERPVNDGRPKRWFDRFDDPQQETA